MNKEEIIERYGEEAWQKILERDRARYKANKEQEKARSKKWKEKHQEQVIAQNQEQNRKGGKRYDKKLEELRTGLQGERNRIRTKHAREYRPYKNIIAPDSQIHHEWIPKTDEYKGVALVEKDAHMHGFIDVIQILDGKITLLTEEEIKKEKKQIGKPTYRTDRSFLKRIL
jgi:uncharacterized protein YaaR (DUF327 family)